MTTENSYKDYFLANSELISLLRRGYANKVFKSLKGQYSKAYIYKVKAGSEKNMKILNSLIELAKKQIEEIESM